MQQHRFADLPAAGAWRLSGAYEGHEVVRFALDAGGTRLDGTTVGVEEDRPWTVHYSMVVSDRWHVRQATVTDHAGTVRHLETDGAGAWTVDGAPRPELDGCLDLDLECSVVTNTLPVHRLALAVGARGASAAVYLRTAGLAVERLDQSYHRRPDEDGRLAFDYESPRFGYRDTLHFDPDGLTADYPGIGARVPL